MDLACLLDLLDNLPSENSDTATEDSWDEEVPANRLLQFLPASEDAVTEQDSGCSEQEDHELSREKTIVPIPGCCKKIDRRWKKRYVLTLVHIFSLKSGFSDTLFESSVTSSEFFLNFTDKDIVENSFSD